MVIKYLNYENLKTLPEEVIENKEITALHLKRNLFEQIPSTICKLENLIELNLNSNFITDLPYKLEELVHLEILDLDRNQLKVIPSSVYRLFKLKRLKLFCNQIVYIDDNVRKLKNLEILNIAHNKLQCLPVSLCYCTKLTSLHLANNNLKYIPKEVLILKKLSLLEVNHNELIVLPFTLFCIESLKSIDVFDNQLIAIPEFIHLESLVIYIDNAFTKEHENVSLLEKRIEKEYGVEILKKSYDVRQPKSLQEYCCSFVFNHFSSDSLEQLKGIIPKKLFTNSCCPFAQCFYCCTFLFSSAHVVVNTRSFKTTYRWQKESSRYFSIALFCSSNCYILYHK